MSLDGKVAAVALVAGFGSVAATAFFGPYYGLYAGLKYVATGVTGALAAGGLTGALYNSGKGH